MIMMNVPANTNSSIGNAENIGSVCPCLRRRDCPLSGTQAVTHPELQFVEVLDAHPVSEFFYVSRRPSAVFLENISPWPSGHLIAVFPPHN